MKEEPRVIQFVKLRDKLKKAGTTSQERLIVRNMYELIGDMNHNEAITVLRGPA